MEYTGVELTINALSRVVGSFDRQQHHGNVNFGQHWWRWRYEELSKTSPYVVRKKKTRRGRNMEHRVVNVGLARPDGSGIKNFRVLARS